MTQKKGKRTNVYLPLNLYEEARRRKYNLSAMFSEYLEMEIYRDTPEFLRKKLDNLDKEYDHSRDLLLAQLKVAEEKHQLKKERIDVFTPEIRRYGIYKKEEDK